MYAYYDGSSVGDAHLVVLTGVDVKNDIVYTNNPHGIIGVQTYIEFLNGYAEMSNKRDCVLAYLYLVNSVG